MFDLVINQDDPHELALLKHIAWELKVMSLKFDVLQAAVTNVSAQADNVLAELAAAQTSDGTHQAVIDSAAAALQAVSAKLVSALPVVVAPPVEAPPAEPAPAV